MNFYEKFISECAKRNLIPSKAMVDMGLSKSTLTRWKYNQSLPSDYLLSVVANFFNCDLEELSAARDTSSVLRAQEATKGKIVPMGKGPDMVPLLGTIACGRPILAYENYEEMVPVPPVGHSDFALKCTGDSMIDAGIQDGDIVYIRTQPTVDSGKIAAVLIGDEATLKYVDIYPEMIVLTPANPDYKPKIYFGPDMDQVSVLGEAVGVYSPLKARERT